MLTLCIDEGNTNAKFGLFAEDSLVKIEKVKGDDDWGKTIKSIGGSQSIDKIIVSSSVEDYDRIKTFVNGYNHVIIEDVMQIPLEIEYKTPQTLGKDRVISSFAASKLFPLEHCAIFDIGTCMTSNFLHKGKTFKGGNIAPGFAMRLDSMHNYTAKLPKVPLESNDYYIGQNTTEALQNGAYYGMLYEMRGFVAELKKKCNQVRTLLTGGSAKYFAIRMEKSIFVDPFLNLKGLHYLSKEL